MQRREDPDMVRPPVPATEDADPNRVRVRHRSVGLSEQQGGGGLEKDLQILLHRPGLDVLDIQSNHPIERERIAAADLPQTRNPRQPAEAPLAPPPVTLDLLVN